MGGFDASYWVLLFIFREMFEKYEFVPDGVI